MWKRSRNVRIEYTPVTGTSPAHLDDFVSYQPLDSTKLKTVRGVDKPFSVPHTAIPSPAAAGAEAGVSTAADVGSIGYNWRGKGWLMIASSKWEILGYGEEETTGNSWIVTYFALTAFTPAGIDFYSRKGNLRPETVENIKKELAGFGGEVETLAAKLFEVRMDDARTD